MFFLAFELVTVLRLEVGEQLIKKPLLLSTYKDSQDRGITLQTAKETPSLKLHIPVYPKTMKA